MLKTPNTSEAGRIAGSWPPAVTDIDLPPAGTKRWVMRRKATVVAGIRCGLLTIEEACKRYTLSHEELTSWQDLIERHGVRALRATRLQQYRDRAPRPAEA